MNDLFFTILKDFGIPGITIALQLYFSMQSKRSGDEIKSLIQRLVEQKSKENVWMLYPEMKIDRNKEIDIISDTCMARVKTSENSIDVCDSVAQPVVISKISTPLDLLRDSENLTVYFNEKNKDVFFINGLVLSSISSCYESNASLRISISPYENHFAYSPPIIISNLKGEWREM